MVLELSRNRQAQYKPERESVNALGLTLGSYYWVPATEIDREAGLQDVHAPAVYRRGDTSRR